MKKLLDSAIEATESHKLDEAIETVCDLLAYAKRHQEVEKIPKKDKNEDIDRFLKVVDSLKQK